LLLEVQSRRDPSYLKQMDTSMLGVIQKGLKAYAYIKFEYTCYIVL